jgi:hypothetical protein
MTGDAAMEVVREAERTLYHAQWRIWEELALARLAQAPGLECAPLVPDSDVIYLVTCNGEYLGHVRRDSRREPEERWVAVRKDQARQIGAYGSAAKAAAALARACGKQTGSIG